jgi:hypothetical protein
MMSDGAIFANPSGGVSEKPDTAALVAPLLLLPRVASSIAACCGTKHSFNVRLVTTWACITSRTE